MTVPPSLDDDLVYMLRNSHLSANSLRDLDREIADRELLKAARLQHQRVHDAAVCASQNYELEEERKRLEELGKQEKRRVKLAELRNKEKAELERLKAVPTPTPPPPPPPKAPEPPKETRKSVATQTLPLQPEIQSQNSALIPPPPTTRPPVQPLPPPSQPPAVNPPTSQLAFPKGGIASPFPTKPLFQTTPQPPSQPQIRQPVHTNSQPASSPHIHPDAARYVQIHQELKKMRKHVKDLSSQIDPSDPNRKRLTPQSQAFKDAVGDLRRALRNRVGQIKSHKGGGGSNKDQITGIMEIMRQALQYQNPAYDPSPFFIRPPPPVQGQPDMLPLVFIYIMNLFAKTIINQFVGEAAIKPEAADPIGTVAVNIIARPAHSWRGAPLIDMLIAKFRITCPVLFGFRGNEKTEQGRERLGWWKSNGAWVPEQTHNDRMTGLGAGYAAISLRDFSKVTTMKNPFPPTNYWTSMAAILSTPPAEISNTQFVVLKAMIDGYEMRFLTFYGSAARAALRIAVIDFPARAAEQNASVTSLSFLGRKIQDDLGLRLV